VTFRAQSSLMADDSFVSTADELAELEARPIDPARREDFTDAQFAVRLALAKRLCAHLTSGADPTMGDWARRIYNRMPMWACYSSLPDGEGLIRRVYGVCRTTNDNEECVHAVSAMMVFNNRVDVPVTEMESNRIERVYASRVLHTSTPGLFIDPLGYLMFISYFNE